MAESIIDGRGNAYALAVNSDGSINVSGVDITIGSLAVSLESIYVTSGTVYVTSGNVAITNIVGVSGTAFQDIVGSVYIDNADEIGGNAGSESWIPAGSVIVTNLPATYPGSVSQYTSPWVIAGSVENTPVNTFVSTAVTLTNSGTQYLLPSSEQSGRLALAIHNNSSGTIWIGDSNVNSLNGILLPADGRLSIDASSNVYGASDIGSTTVATWEMK